MLNLAQGEHVDPGIELCVCVVFSLFLLIGRRD